MSNQVFERVLSAARQLGASDVHLKAGLPPIFRIKGSLRTVRDVPALSREVIAQFAVAMMNDKQRTEFEETMDVDLAYSTPDGVRYRVNRRAPGRNRNLSERWRKINRARSRTRACCEHPFRVIKQLWGFQKVRYRGIAKNLARAQTMFALANLYAVRHRLLPPEARCVL